MRIQKRAYIECALNKLGSLLRSLRQFRTLKSNEIFFFLLVRQSNHELWWPNRWRRRRFAASGGGPTTLFAIVRRLRRSCGLVIVIILVMVMVVVVVGPFLIVRTPIWWSNSPNASVAMTSHGTWSLRVSIHNSKDKKILRNVFTKNIKHRTGIQPKFF